MVEKGEYITIVGHSGSGKTTMLLTIGGLINPDNGKVSIDDTSLYDISIKKLARLRLQRIGFLFQTFNLIPYLTSLQNVMIPLYIAGKSKIKQIERATELLDSFGLSNRLEHKPSELSIGQQQRVALARTFANDPEIILADEPTGNLDPEMTEELITVFNKIHSEGKTIMIVTHNYHLADQGKRQLKITEGQLTNRN